MKKIIAISFLALLSLSAFAEKKKLTIKNTVGANADELGSYNLFERTNETDIDDNVISENTFAFGDRLQLDYESNLITARARLEVLYNSGSLEPSLLIAPSGFIYYTPIKQFGLVAGTNFYKQFEIASGYLAAADETTKYARMLTDSLGYDSYLGSDSFAISYNGYGGGLTGNFTWGALDQYYLKLAAGSMLYSDNTTFDYSIDFGLNAGAEGLFDAGFTAHNLLSDDRKFGAFAGLTYIPDLILNAGFYYNFTDSDYLPEARVERSDEDEFKKQKTKYAFGLTGGYNFKSIGLGIYADFITGLTNEYIGDVKYYDSDGNLIKTVTTTIIRGASCVKYKNGKAKRTDGFTPTAVPYYAQLRLSYDVSDSVNLALNLKLRSMIRDSSQTWITIYPRTCITLPGSAGEINTGLLLDMNLTRYEGLSGISVPVSYTYKFKKKF